MFITNDPTRAGQHASEVQEFGPNGRFTVMALHTRFENVRWFVKDARIVKDTETGLNWNIGQHDNEQDAVAQAERAVKRNSFKNQRG